MGNVIAKNRKAYGYDYADLGSVVNYVTETLKVKVQQSIQYDNLPQYPNGYGFVVTRYWKDDRSLGARLKLPSRSSWVIPQVNVNSRSCNGMGVRKPMREGTVCSPCSVLLPVMMTASWLSISVAIR